MSETVEEITKRTETYLKLQESAPLEEQEEIDSRFISDELLVFTADWYRSKYPGFPDSYLRASAKCLAPPKNGKGSEFRESRQNCGQLDGRGMSDGRGEERACSLGCHVPGKPSRAASGRGARERRLVLQVAGSAARGAASGDCSWWAAEALVRSPASPGVPRSRNWSPSRRARASRRRLRGP